MLFDSIRDAIGHTPLIRLRIGAPHDVLVYAKLEMANPFGMKDRAARQIIMEARRIGVLRDGAPIVESSSGTMALGVALVGRSLGHPVHIVTDPRIDHVTLAKLRAMGCHVHIVQAMTSRGWQSARLERLGRLLAELPGAFWPQQYSNPDNPGAYRGLAEEILADLGPIDVLVGSVGSGGSLCGSARFLRRVIPGLRVVGVDCVGSALFDQPDQPHRLQSGLGNSLLPQNLDRRLIDEVHWLNDGEAFGAAHDLASEQQIFAGNTGGSVYRVLRDVAARATPGSRIVGLFPDRGDRYAETVYSEEFWAKHGLAATTAPAAEPVRYGMVVQSWSRASTEGVRAGRARLLFVESNTTGSGMLALRAAAALGLRPALVTGDPARYKDLGAIDCEVLDGDSSSVAALRSTIQERFRREEIAGVTTTSDFYVQAVADLADWLVLPANPVDAVARCRDKAATRSALAAAGFLQPRFSLVTSVEDVAAAVADVGLPCVVKPTDDSGSSNVMLCCSQAEAAEQTGRILAIRVNVRGLPTAGAVLIEEYLDAPEFSVETFSLGGETVFAGVTAKMVSRPPYFVETGHKYPARLPPPAAESLLRVTQAALAAVGVRFGPAHTEVKLARPGPAIIEINPRLAGGMIPELIKLATGIDLVEQQLRAAAGLPVSFTQTATGHAGIRFLTADRPGTLLRVEGTDRAERIEAVRQVTVTIPAGSAVRCPQSAYDRLGYVIAAGSRAGEVEKALDLARSHISILLADDGIGRAPDGEVRHGERAGSRH
jgi:S-sulfo-L-cysteine synthase (3-phospho-L-serine-dependent)